MKIVYEGPLEAVEIAATGQIAERGEPLDVEPGLAAQLVEQADWTDPNAPDPEPDPLVSDDTSSDDDSDDLSYPDPDPTDPTDVPDSSDEEE